MDKVRKRTVYCRPDGMWVTKRRGSEGITGIHRTLWKAIEAVEGDLIPKGGGEMTVIGEDGRIISIDTIVPCTDPPPATPTNKARKRTVYCRPDGMWVTKRYGSEKIMGVHRTLWKAIEAVEGDLIPKGGGEMTVIGEDGRIISIDTIAPCTDRFPATRHGH